MGEWIKDDYEFGYTCLLQQRLSLCVLELTNAVFQLLFQVSEFTATCLHQHLMDDAELTHWKCGDPEYPDMLPVKSMIDMNNLFPGGKLDREKKERERLEGEKAKKDEDVEMEDAAAAAEAAAEEENLP